jgi:hypothetical protein
VGVSNCRETGAGKIATSTMPPGLVSTIRHVSFGGHGGFTVLANRSLLQGRCQYSKPCREVGSDFL